MKRVGFAMSASFQFSCRRLFRALCCLALVVVARESRAEIVGNGVELLGHFGGVCRAAAVQGNLAFMAEGSYLRIVDITQPDNPVPLGAARADDLIEGVTISGNHAYVAASKGGVQIVDFSNPSSPVVVGSCPTMNARRIAVSNGTAYVADVWGGLAILDVRNPSKPSKYVQFSGYRYYYDVVLSGTLALIADDEFGLVAYDVSVPTIPVLIGRAVTHGEWRSVALSGNTAYLAGTGGLQAIDVSNPLVPQILGQTGSVTSGLRIAYRDNLVYVAEGEQGMRVVDVCNPAAPVPHGAGFASQGAWDLALSGNLAAVADQGRGISFLNISNPSAPSFVGKYWSAWKAYSTTVSGGFAYLANLAGSIRIYDISSLSHPVLIRDFETSGSAFQVKVSNDGIAYVASGSAGLQVFDVMDPSAPVLLGTQPLGTQPLSSAVDVEVQNGVAYVAAGFSGIHLVDVGNPAAPSYLGGFDTPGSARRVALSENRNTAYVSDLGGGMQIVDVRSTTSPAYLGFYDARAYCAAVAGNTVYLAGAYTGFHVVDVANPANPRSLGILPPSESSLGFTDVLLNDGFVVTGEGSSIRFLDVCDPKAIVARASWRVSGSVDSAIAALSAESGLVYVTHRNLGVFAVRYPGYATWKKDDFSTGGLVQGTAGWSGIGFNSPLGWTDYSSSAGAYRCNVAPSANRFRVTGLMTNSEQWLPYSTVGTQSCVRAKYYVYAGGQSDPGNDNQIPNLRMRLSNRYAVTSMLEVFHHTNDTIQHHELERELRPSTDPTSPSCYRVDFDPVDVPFLVANAQTEGISRAFETYAVFPQDEGYLALTECSIGTYPNTDISTAVAPLKTYVADPGGAGDLAVFNSSELKLTKLVAGSSEGEFASEETTGVLPTYAEGGWGVTLDTAGVAADRIGVATRDFNPDRNTNSYSTRARVEAGKLYSLRWHLTSTQQTNLQAQIRLRTRSVKFSWAHKLEIGGAWGVGHQLTPLNANNTIAQQSLPGVGTQNPDRNASDTAGGWYTALFPTPLEPDIRPEFAADVPLSVRMPNLTAQPGPGENSSSRRDIFVGVDLVDTISSGAGASLEQGNVTVDRIEIRAHDRAAD